MNTHSISDPLESLNKLRELLVGGKVIAIRMPDDSIVEFEFDTEHKLIVPSNMLAIMEKVKKT